MTTATAQAFANIAFIKYWGNCNADSRVPSNGSISMNLGGLHTRTQVTFDPSLAGDVLILDGKQVSGPPLERVRVFLDHVRQLTGIHQYARIESANNFPMGVGIASSASAFAALALAATAAAGFHLSEKELSRLARLGSGSACRSVPGGFIEWQVRECDDDSYAFSIAPPEHWKLVDCIALVSQRHKPVGSSEGHALAATSPLQAARVAGSTKRLDLCRSTILEKDFSALAEVVELDSNLMHAVMMTSSPPLFYWQAATVEILHQVPEWRKNGLPACYTVDAGPNVHVLCPEDYSQQVRNRLSEIPGVSQVLIALPGGPAHLISAPDLS